MTYSGDEQNVVDGDERLPVAHAVSIWLDSPLQRVADLQAEDEDLAQFLASRLEQARLARHGAQFASFEAYHATLSAVTLRAEQHGLRRFARYLVACGRVPAVPANAADTWMATGAAHNPAVFHQHPGCPEHAEAQAQQIARVLWTDERAWAAVRSDLVSGLRDWLWAQGMAPKTVNHTLVTLRMHARVAAAAGTLPWDAVDAIDGVRSFGFGAGRRLTTALSPITPPRPLAPTSHPPDVTGGHARVSRRGARTPVILSDAQAEALRRQPDTPRGRFDALLACFVLDLGLRPVEITEIRLADCVLGPNGSLQPPRVRPIPKDVCLDGLLRALEHYLCLDRLLLGAWDDAPLLCSLGFDGLPIPRGISTATVTAHVQALGVAIGCDHLTPMDCRAYWAAQLLMRGGLDMFNFLATMRAGGWRSGDVLYRYAARMVPGWEGGDILEVTLSG